MSGIMIHIVQITSQELTILPIYLLDSINT